jgi:hypothetical protein
MTVPRLAGARAASALACLLLGAALPSLASRVPGRALQQEPASCGTCPAAARCSLLAPDAERLQRDFLALCADGVSAQCCGLLAGRGAFSGATVLECSCDLPQSIASGVTAYVNLRQFRQTCMAGCPGAVPAGGGGGLPSPGEIVSSIVGLGVAGGRAVVGGVGAVVGMSGRAEPKPTG